jgi:hypothetical protein
MTSIPSGYMLLSGAVASLEDGMFGGMARPEMVRQVKKDLPRLSVGFGPRRQQAAARLYEVLVGGELPTYVEFWPETSDRLEPQLLPVAPIILKSLPRSRSGLRDRVRVPTSLLRTGAVDGELFRALSSGRLLLKQSEFEKWYRRERDRGTWPSQRERKQRRVGRPSKHAVLHSSIVALVNSGRWNGNNNTVAELAAMISEISHAPAVSHDTVARAVDHLFREGGDERLRRRPRKKPMR